MPRLAPPDLAVGWAAWPARLRAGPRAGPGGGVECPAADRESVVGSVVVVHWSAEDAVRGARHGTAQGSLSEDFECGTSRSATASDSQRK